MLMLVIAHGGVLTHVRESALKVDSGRKIPCRSGKSNLPQRRAGPTLYQLSYIPTLMLALKQKQAMIIYGNTTLSAAREDLRREKTGSKHLTVRRKHSPQTLRRHRQMTVVAFSSRAKIL